MNDEQQLSLTPTDIARTVCAHRKLIFVPAVAGFVLAAAYALIVPRPWRASQTLIVRAEAAGLSDTQIGKFSDLSEMKILQETILELAKSRNVILATLNRVGKPRGFFNGNWPTPEDVEEFRKNLKITPPGGAEFGKTEVFYLSALDTSRDRAKQLVAALCDELEMRLQQLQDERAGSMIAELENAVAAAHTDLQREIDKLAAVEAQVGADLNELRNLDSNIGGTSETAQQLRDIETERRANLAAQRASQQLVALLKSAQSNPEQLAAMPQRLLANQPTLQQLKQALLDAQVNTAGVLGAKTPNHPAAIAAIDAEARIRSYLTREFDAAIKGLEFDVEYCSGRDTELLARLESGRERLSQLAAVRADYSNLVAAVDDHTQLVESARRSLADARAKQAGAQSASILARIDGVDAGTRPVGPGRTVMAGAGGVGGMLFGLGVMFLIASPAPVGSSGRAAAAPHASTETHGQTTVSNTFIPTVAVAAAPETFDINVGDHWSVNDQPHPHADEPFGLFRGMSLREAVRKVERQLVECL